MWHSSLVGTLRSAGIDLRLLAVASDNEEYAMAREHGWLAIKYENLPLGRKFNRVMEAVPKVFGDDVDAIIVIGSDDYLTASYIMDATHVIRQGGEYAAAKTAYMIDSESGRSVKFRGNVTIGGGRIVTADLMRTCKWRPWEDGLNSGLDASFDRTLRIIESARKDKIQFQVVENDGLMTLKSGTNIWSYDFLLGRVLTEEAPGDMLYAMYPAVFDMAFHSGIVDKATV